MTLTATVANATPHASGIPTGTVQFQVNGSPLGAPVTLSGGRASLTIAPFSAVNPTVTVVYTSNTRNFSGSSSALSSSQFPLAVATVLNGEGASPYNIAFALRNSFGQGGVQIGSILAGLGATPDQIAAALKNATGASDLSVASILAGLGDSAEQVAESLENIYGDAGTAVGVILDEVGYAGGAIADALVDVFGMAANQIAELFTNTLGLSDSATEIDMDAAGFNWTFYPDGTASEYDDRNQRGRVHHLHHRLLQLQPRLDRRHLGDDRNQRGWVHHNHHQLLRLQRQLHRRKRDDDRNRRGWVHH